MEQHLARTLPGRRGFTRRNLFRMQQFFETYRGDEKVTPLLTQLPWTHNLIILTQSKRTEEREFCEVVEYAPSRAPSPALVAQYQTQLPDKQMLAAKLQEVYALSVREETEPVAGTTRRKKGRGA